MGVDELRALIADVVRDAVGGLQARQAVVSGEGGKEASTACLGQPVVIDDAGNGVDGEEIVVAGSLVGSGGGATTAAAADGVVDAVGDGDVPQVESSEL